MAGMVGERLRLAAAFSDTPGVELPRPIHSLLVDDHALEQLDAFVIALGERIDGIQEAEHEGQLEEAAKRAAELAIEAQALGLPPLVEAAERVVASCRQGAAGTAHADIVELTDVVTRVRLGHRGSAY
jgi:hypothetical protein